MKIKISRSKIINSSNQTRGDIFFIKWFKGYLKLFTEAF